MNIRNISIENMARAFVAVAALVTVPAGALAQAEVTSQVQPVESGVKFGPGRLTPSLEIQTRYDSMAGYVPDAAAEGGLRQAGDLIIHLKPGLHFVAPSESVEIALKAVYDYHGYTGAEESSLTEQSRQTLSFDAGALFGKSRDTRAEITNRFARSDRTSNLSLGAASISNRDDATLRVTQVGGKLWSITPSYTFTYEGFESLSGREAEDTLVEQYDYMAHNVRVDARYQAFSQSVVMLDVNVGHRGYLAENAVGEDVGNTKVMIGLNGKITQKIGYTLKGGYGTQFGLSDDDGYNGAIGNAELAWFATQLSDVRAGYLRGFEADPTYQFYANDRVYLNAGTMLGSKLKVRGGVSYDIIGFGEDGEREDTLLGFNLSPEYAFNRWFIGGVGYGYTVRATDGLEQAALSPFLDYDRHEVLAKATFVY